MEVSGGDDGKLSIHKYKLDSLFAREELGDDDSCQNRKAANKIHCKARSRQMISVEQLTRLVARADMDSNKQHSN